MKNILSGFIILLLLSSNSNAQNTTTIQNQFEIYQQNILQEKLFVHTDKSKYLTGEILWFKVYNVNASNNKPLQLSKVAYIEVLDDKQTPVMQAKIALKGNSAGSFYIPVSLASGNYKLRAYTNWMKNFSVNGFFEKDLTILNPLLSPVTNLSKPKPVYDIQFFPEGGNLVDGLTSKVAFKVVDGYGKSVNFKGAVINQNNDTLVKFKPLKFGMGTFKFMPNLKNKYRAVVNISTENKSIVTSLPEIHQSGYVMEMKDNEKQLQVDVVSNITGSEVFLLVSAKNVSKSVQGAHLVNGSASFLISKDLLGDGITHLTVFNSEKTPVCERLYFKQPTQNVFLNVLPDQLQYDLRKKINIDVNAKDRLGKPLAVDFSTSVYQTDSFQDIDPINIVNYLELTSELRGHVESPDYYFNSKDSLLKEAADDLMLTQGWSSFNWNEVLKNQKPSFTFLPEYEGHIVNAKLTNMVSNQPAKDVTCYLSVPGKRVQFYISKSDSAGILHFNTNNFYGSGEIIVQTNEKEDSTFHIEILNPFYEKYAANTLQGLSLSEEMKSDLEAKTIDMQVQNIYSNRQLKQFFDPKIDSSEFFGKLHTSYLLDNYTRFTTMEEVLREYIKSVVVTKQQKNFRLKIIGERSFLEGQPTILLDGIPVFDMNKLIAFDPLKVRKIELVKNGYFWQSAELQGILNFTTYKGDLGGYEIDPKAVVVDYEGMQLERKFYSPVYQTKEEIAARLPDFRNVLYWSPSTITDQNGKANLTFYTSDKVGNYVGVMQGITANGEVTSQYFKFEVKQNYSASTK